MQIYGISNVDDYVYRPRQCESMTLYDWVRLATKQKIPKAILRSLKNTDEHIVDKICDHRWEKNHVQFPINFIEIFIIAFITFYTYLEIIEDKKKYFLSINHYIIFNSYVR